MPPHIDVYPADNDSNLWGKGERWLEEDDAAQFSSRYDSIGRTLPYFNGYSLTTAVHEDGECHLHRPRNPIYLPHQIVHIDTAVEEFFENHEPIDSSETTYPELN